LKEAVAKTVRPLRDQVQHIVPKKLNRGAFANDIVNEEFKEMMRNEDDSWDNSLNRVRVNL
jgi:hypothetical protein